MIFNLRFIYRKCNYDTEYLAAVKKKLHFCVSGGSGTPQPQFLFWGEEYSVQRDPFLGERPEYDKEKNGIVDKSVATSNFFLIFQAYL